MSVFPSDNFNFYAFRHYALFFCVADFSIYIYIYITDDCLEERNREEKEKVLEVKEKVSDKVTK